MSNKKTSVPSSTKKKWMLEKLKRLVSLCAMTEPEKPDDNFLFTPHCIDANEMYDKIDIKYDHITAEERVSIMKHANKIWRFRKKIWNGDFSSDMEAEMHDYLEDLISQNQKISAIKYYRSVMEEHFGEKIGLREAKEFVDDIQAGMRSRGIIK